MIPWMMMAFITLSLSVSAQVNIASPRRMSVEVRQGDAGGTFQLNLEGREPELIYDSPIGGFRKTISRVDADYLREKIMGLPVVPSLPTDCRRDYARVLLSPDDQRPRATCLQNTTAYSAKYRSVVETLAIAKLKYGGVEAARSDSAPPAKDGRAKPESRP